MSRPKSSGRSTRSSRPKKAPLKNRSAYAHARIADEAARRLSRLGVPLDFSPASLAGLDAHLSSLELTGGLADGGAPTSEQEDVLLSFGSYLGETLRKRLGGEWCDLGDDDVDLTSRIRLVVSDDVWWAPLQIVAEQLGRRGDLRCLDHFETCRSQVGKGADVPDEAGDWARFAATLVRADRLEGALRLLRRATELAPATGAHWAARGEVEDKLALRDDARSSFEKALATTAAGDARLAFQQRIEALRGPSRPPEPLPDPGPVTPRVTPDMAGFTQQTRLPPAADAREAQVAVTARPAPSSNEVDAPPPPSSAGPAVLAPPPSEGPPTVPAAPSTAPPAASVEPEAVPTTQPPSAAAPPSPPLATDVEQPVAPRPVTEPAREVDAPAPRPAQVARTIRLRAPVSPARVASTPRVPAITESGRRAPRDAVRESIRVSVAGAAPRSVPPATQPVDDDAPEASEVVVDSLSDGLIELAQKGDVELLDMLLDESVGDWTEVEGDLVAWLERSERLDVDARRAACGAAMVLAERKGFRPSATPEEAAPSLRLLEKASLALGAALAPVARARLMLALAAAISDQAVHDTSRNQEEALQLVESTLTLVDARTQPDLWGRAHKLLGNVQLRRPMGPRREHVESALGAFRAALRVVSSTTSPEAWAALQGDLGHAFHKRAGDRDRNVESAIEAFSAALSVLSRERTPIDWALSTLALGQCLLERNVADRAATIERAIVALKGASEVLPAGSAESATAHYKLALAHQRRKAGSRAENLENAVRHYELALPDLEGPEAQSAGENLEAARRELAKKR